jgi:hypothetical protein
MATDISDIHGTLATLTTQVNELEAQRAAAFQDNVALMAQVVAKDKEIAALKAEIATLKAEIVRLQAIIDGGTDPEPEPEPEPTGDVTLETLRKGTFHIGKVLSGCSNPSGGWSTYTTTVGKPANIWHEYSTSGAGFKSDLTAVPKGAIPMINFKPGGMMGPAEYLKIIAGGRDTEIKTAAAATKLYGKPVFIAPLHEPENDDLVASSFAVSDKNYAKAFAHIVSMFRSEGVTNGIYTWNMMGFVNHIPRYTNLYPGDTYVDWIGGDPYAHATSVTLANLGKEFYDKMLTIIKVPKPFMWAEYGWDKPTGQAVAAQRLTAAELDKMQTAMPFLRGLVYWNQALGTDPKTDYRFTNFSAAFKTFGQLSEFDMVLPAAVTA